MKAVNNCFVAISSNRLNHILKEKIQTKKNDSCDYDSLCNSHDQ